MLGIENGVMGEKAGGTTTKRGSKRWFKGNWMQSVAVKFGGAWAPVVCLAGLAGREQWPWLYRVRSYQGD